MKTDEGWIEFNPVSPSVKTIVSPSDIKRRKELEKRADKYKIKLTLPSFNEEPREDIGVVHQEHFTEYSEKRGYFETDIFGREVTVLPEESVVPGSDIGLDIDEDLVASNLGYGIGLGEGE